MSAKEIRDFMGKIGNFPPEALEAITEDFVERTYREKPKEFKVSAEYGDGSRVTVQRNRIDYPQWPVVLVWARVFRERLLHLQRQARIFLEPRRQVYQRQISLQHHHCLTRHRRTSETPVRSRELPSVGQLFVALSILR